jgi:hypothetical protein
LIRRAAFFAGVRFDFVRFAAFARAALRALPRRAEFPLRSFARFCTFDPLLRLAMIDPLWVVLRNALMLDQSQTGRMEVVKWDWTISVRVRSGAFR